MTRRDIPNLISILRIILVIPVVLLMKQQEFGLALILFFVAGISDGVDGYLAKRNQWQSRLGSILDPLADKVLLISSYVMLGWLGYLPLWLVAAVLIRDVVIVVGALLYHFIFGQYEMAPSFVSKLNTFMQIVLIMGLVFSLGLYELPPLVISLLIYIVFVTTLASGLSYVLVWGKRAFMQRKGTA